MLEKRILETEKKETRKNRYQHKQNLFAQKLSLLTLVNVLGQRLDDAITGDLLQSNSDSLDEALVTTQIVTKQLLNAEKSSGVAGLSQSAELIEHGVLNLELVSIVINTVDVVEPGSGSEAETTERTGHPDSFGNSGHDELGDLSGTTTTDARKLVANWRIGETFNECFAVLINIVTFDVGECVLHFLLHHLPDKFGKERVLHNFVNIFVSGQLATIGDDSVATVQKTELVLLEFLDVLNVLDNLNADLLERWATITEVIFNDPLHEGLSHNGPRILDTELLCEAHFIGGGCGWGNTVDHGVGEVTVGVHPVC